MPNRELAFVLTLALLVLSKAVFADPLPPIVKVAIREGGDERLTPEEYDAEPGRHPGDFLRKYGATVKIKCPFAWSTGNLVFKRDLVVTVAHAFEKRDESDPDVVKCSAVTSNELDQCYVQKLGAGERDTKYSIDTSTIKYPLTSTCIQKRDSANDVAYFRLKHEVSGVDPYGIYDQATLDPASMLGARFNKVSAFNERFKWHPLETFSISENITILQVGPAPAGSANTMYISDVSGTKGNSGSGLFVDDAKTGRPLIFSVMSWATGFAGDGKKFSKDNYNLSPAISRSVADLIREEAARPYP